MANEQVISEFIDRTGVAGDKQFMLTQLNEIYDSYKKLADVRIGLGKVDSQAGYISQVNQAANAVQIYDNALKAVNARIAEHNGHSKEFTQVLQGEANARKRTADAALSEAKAETERAKAAKAMADAALNEAKAETERAKAKAAATREVENSAKATANEQKLIEQATNDYLQLSKAYNEASLKAKNYVLRLGENHPIAVEAVKDANDLGNVLKKLDAAVGQNQRNVGNYKSAFDGLGFSFTQVARELPSLAINFQTFALAISNNLPMVADELRKAKIEIAALKAEGQDTPSLFQRIWKSLTSGQVGLSVLITLLTVFAGKLFGAGSASNKFSKDLTDLGDAGDRVKRSLEDVNREIDYFYRKRSLQLNIGLPSGFSRDVAQAKNDLAKIDDQIGEMNGKIPGLLNQSSEAYAKFTAVAKRSTIDLIDSYGAVYNIPDELISSLPDKEQKALAAAKKVSKSLYDLQIDLDNKRNERDLLRDQLKVIQADEQRRKAEMAFDQEEKDKEARFNIEKLRLQQLSDEYERIAEDESKPMIERYKALHNYEAAQNSLIQLEQNYELQRREIVDNRIVLVKRTTAQIKEVEEDALDKSLKMVIHYEDLRKKIIEDNRKKIAFIIQSAETDQFDKMYESFKTAIKLAQEQEAVFDKLYKDRTAFAKGYYSEVEKLSKQRLENESKRKEQELDLNTQLYQQLRDTFQAFVTAKIDRELADIQKQKDAIDDRAKRESDIAQQTITNEQDKAAALTAINIRSQQEKDQLDQKEREIQRRRDNIERNSQLAQIAGEVASGVINLQIKAAEARAQALILAANPLTAGLAGAATASAALIQAQIPYIIGLGALKAASLIFPKYATGTDDHPGGPAWVGDGGKREVVETKDGKRWITPRTPTLVDLPAHAKVFPDASVIMRNAAINSYNEISQTVTPVPQYDYARLEAKLDMNNQLLAQLVNKKDLDLTVTEAGLFAIWKQGRKRWQNLNDKLNF